jgi:hypothetical protein
VQLSPLLAASHFIGGRMRDALSPIAVAFQQVLERRFVVDKLGQVG